MRKAGCRSPPCRGPNPTQPGMSGRADGCLSRGTPDAKETEVDSASRRSTDFDDIRSLVYFADMGSSTLASDHDRRSQRFEVSANGECRIGPC